MLDLDEFYILWRILQTKAEYVIVLTMTEDVKVEEFFENLV